MNAIEALSKAMDDNHRRIEDIRNTLGGAFLKLDSDTVIALGTEMKKLEENNGSIGTELLAIEARTKSLKADTDFAEGLEELSMTDPAAEGIAAAKKDAAIIAEASGVPCPDFLTEKEFEVLTAVYEVAGNSYDINNLDQLRNLLDDHYSWFEAADVTAALPEMKQEAVAALLGSLEKKGLISNNIDQVNGEGPWLSDIHVDCTEKLIEHLKK